MTVEMHYICVYGTLRRGGKNYRRLLSNTSTFIKAIQLKGYSLFRMYQSELISNDYPCAIKSTEALLSAMNTSISSGDATVSTGDEIVSSRKRTAGVGNTIKAEIFAVDDATMRMLCRVESEYIPVPITQLVEIDGEKKRIQCILFVQDLAYYKKSKRNMIHITHGDWMKYAEEHQIE